MTETTDIAVLTLGLLLEKLFLLGMQAQSHRMYQSEGVMFGVCESRLDAAIQKNDDEKRQIMKQIMQFKEQHND